LNSRKADQRLDRSVRNQPGVINAAARDRQPERRRFKAAAVTYGSPERIFRLIGGFSGNVHIAVTWRRRLASGRAMPAQRVEVAPRAFDGDPCFGRGIEELALEKRVAKPGVERLDEAVFPAAAGCDVGGLRADRAMQPLRTA